MFLFYYYYKTVRSNGIQCITLCQHEHSNLLLRQIKDVGAATEVFILSTTNDYSVIRERDTDTKLGSITGCQLELLGPKNSARTRENIDTATFVAITW